MAEREPIEELVSPEYKLSREQESRKSTGRPALPLNKRKNMPRYSVSLTQKNLEQITAIQNELGFASISETVRGCIHAMYSKTFPNYTRSAGQGLPNRNVDYSEPVSQADLAEQKKIKAEQAIEKKKLMAEQEKANQIDYCVNICENELKGVVGEDVDGKPKTCAYFQYDGRRRYEQEIDIMSVTPALLETQYLPNKDRVLKLQADGNIDYDLNQAIEDVLEAN